MASIDASTPVGEIAFDAESVDGILRHLLDRHRADRKIALPEGGSNEP